MLLLKVSTYIIALIHTSICTVPPPSVTITSTPITSLYYAGTPLNLTCNIQLNPQLDTPVTITATWFRSQTTIITLDNYTTILPLSMSSSSYVTKLMFNPLGTSESGSFSCYITVQSGTPYALPEGVIIGILSLQVLGQCYQCTPSILTIFDHALFIRSSCSHSHHHFFPPYTLSWCNVLTDMSSHGGSWSGITC